MVAAGIFAGLLRNQQWIKALDRDFQSQLDFLPSLEQTFSEHLIKPFMISHTLG